MVKEVCNYWREHREVNGEDITTKDLSNIYNLNRSTITRYLKNGNKLNWCNYSSSEALIRNGKKNGKRVLVYDLNMNYITEGESATWLQRHSIEKFDIYLGRNYIRDVCKGKRSSYKGFIFKYAKDVDK